MNSSDDFDRPDEIAIIGMSGRFPGAASVEEFWLNVRDGVESISFFTDEQLKDEGISAALSGAPNYVNAKAVLQDAEMFDAAFFGFNPREVEILDPQHRLFLECAWEALENAGYDSEQYSGLIGVYGGTSMSTYLLNIYSNRELMKSVGSFQVAISNDKDHLTARVSYKLGLTGPSVGVQTACSTSLVAIHLASQSLLNGECDIALAGGVSIKVPQRVGYQFKDGGILSPDGHCRAFDAEAQGTVAGEGVGIVVLKRLSEALADGDCIQAVIKGSATNNDGSLRVGYTAPAVDGQARVIADTLALSGVEPETINYIEAHGTGTALGDPIEIAALTKAYRAATPEKGFCAIGSVKTNIGHLDAAAGVTGLIKTVMALKHEMLPPSLHFRESNPQIDFDNSPFYVNTTLTKWKSGLTPRRAAVSSFGMGGTNAHVILEEAPVIEPSKKSGRRHLLLISARTSTALDKATANLAAYLKQNSETNLADVAYTLQVGRRRFGHCRMVVCLDLEDALKALDGREPERLHTHVKEPGRAGVTFMFSGQGTQYVNMGLELYRTVPQFSEQVDLCSQLLKPHLGIELSEVLYPGKEETESAARQLGQTFITQPALFVIEYALAKMWMAWGVKPAAMIGHSIGEYVAACLAGVFTLEEALELVAARGRLMQEIAPGAMLSVSATAQDLEPYLNEHLSLAAVNAPAQCVISGTIEAVAALESRLNAEGRACRLLQTSHAFHSQAMDSILERFVELVKRVKLKSPKIRYVSNLTGKWITEQEATDPDYWARHLRETVRFAEGIQEITKETNQVLLEVGPGRTLGTLARRNQGKDQEHVVLSSLRHPQEQVSDEAFLMNTLGKLWMAGAEINWSALYAGKQRHRLALPAYPFERKRYWVESNAKRTGDEARHNETQQNNNSSSSHTTQDETLAQTDIKEIVMSKPLVSTDTNPARLDSIVATLKDMTHKLTGIDPVDIETRASFFELGVDSLLLIQASQTIGEEFAVEIPFRRMFEDLSSIDALAVYLNKVLPPDAIATAPRLIESTPVVLPPQTSFQPPIIEVVEAAANRSIDEEDKTLPAIGGLEGLIAQQLRVMSQQLEVLASSRSAPELLTRPRLTNREPVQLATEIDELPLNDALAGVSAATEELAASSNGGSAKTDIENYIPYKQLETGVNGSLPAKQKDYLDSLIARHTERTKESKRLTQAYRAFLADPRSAAGFRLLWKEMIYPIIVDRAHGSKIWDVDGNEYVDLTMGFGIYLFGHSPSFITEALQEQLGKGIQVGPQSHLAGRVAELIYELTGMERSVFCNSGTEAVMVAFRVARTVTKRTKVALFAGSYHGSFDATLVKSLKVDGEKRTVAIAPGTPPGMIEDIIVLDYGSAESLDFLKANLHELAAVLVEPVQSRRPGLQPTEFLRELRELTQAAGTVLIFDEVVTGFRSHPGGAQAWFGVQADLAVYGKVVGGGMPIGVLSGKAAFMGAIDGGWWSFGDASFPEQQQTFFAGTFCKHPLTMASALAVLTHIKAGGPAIQAKLNERTLLLAGILNDFFKQEQVPLRVDNFSSLFLFVPSRGMKYVDLFFWRLLEKGFYMWEGRTCFLSTAHAQEDVDRFVVAVKETVAEMQAAEFFSSPSSAVTGGEALAERLDAPRVEADVKDAYRAPLTAGQRDLWILTQMGEDASSSYNESVTLDLRGHFQPIAMQTAIQRLVDHHESLRTTFDEKGEFQQINPTMTISVPLTDASHAGHSESELEAAELLAQEGQQPLDLVNGPLVRARIIKLEEEHHILALTVHHLVADGWSVGVLLRDLKRLYAAECKGEACLLAEPMPYSEYVQQQAEAQESPRMATAEAYWLGQFATPAPVLELPTDQPRPSIRTFNGAQQSLTIDNQLFGELKKLSAQQGCTLFVTLLAAYSTLLHRLSGQDDLVVGIASAGQLSARDNYLVGHCVNLLPLRSVVETATTFKDYLRFIKMALLDAHEHQTFPLSELIQKLNLPWDPSRAPLVSTAFNLDYAGPGLEFFGLEAAAAINPNGYSKFDISVNVTQKEKELVFDCDFNSDLFNPQTVERWMNHLKMLLEGAVLNVEQRICDLPLLTDAEEFQLKFEWNDTKTEYPRDICLHELFEAQVERTPEAIALIFEEKQFSYRELNERANQLAHHLRNLGVKPGMLVGTCLDRSWEVALGLLGILKAGGAYVPFDPESPAERLAFMVEDSAPLVLLTQERFVKGLPACKASVVCLDWDWEEIAGQSRSNPDVATSRQDLAYVIYTSGTTGKPKGVMVEHDSIVNYLLAAQDRFEFTGQDVVPVVSPFSFDISLFELLSPLLVGGAAVLLTEEQILDGAQFATALEDATLFHAAPGLMRHIVNFLKDNGAGNRHKKMSRILVGGDMVPPDLLKDIRTVFSSSSIYENYGPTEGTIMCLSYLVPPNAPTVKHIIGKPMNNMSVRMYDKQQHLVPIGVSGELYIGGAAVSRGYLGRPELTGEKFVTIDDERFYRTGDLVRYLPDGNIEIIGRIDHQIKIRGFRIELGEVEAALGQHTDVREVVVMAREAFPGDNRLVAYLVANSQTAPSATEFRSFLKTKLPEYMVPSAFVLLDKLPLTSTGKVDRPSLPLPDWASPELKEEFVAPSRPIEQELAEIWIKVLGVNRVGINDNFFSLGGHSLLATRVLSLVMEVFHVRLTLRSLFESPTVALLALAIEQKQLGQEDFASTRIEALPRGDESLDQLLGEIGQLSESEVEELLALELNAPA
jgi:amino acid adenylation domain-containing protein